MINVFDYTDFRKYLADFYEEKKSESHAFSYKYLAGKAGFRNKGFVYNIIRGDKPLSKSNIFKMSEALGHNSYEAEYFEQLVAFNQASALKERNHFFERMSRIRNRGRGKVVTKAQTLRQDQYEFCSKWYHVMIRSLIDMYEFKNDYKWLARMVTPPVTVIQAKQSVRLLEKLGLIGKRGNGTYKVSSKSLTTGKKVLSLAAQNFHVQCTDLAKRALQEMPATRRNITGLTLGISQKSYTRICDEIQAFQERVMEIANTDDEANRVYQFNFHLFPTSEADTERRQKS